MSKLYSIRPLEFKEAKPGVYWTAPFVDIGFTIYKGRGSAREYSCYYGSTLFSECVNLQEAFDECGKRADLLLSPVLITPWRMVAEEKPEQHTQVLICDVDGCHFIAALRGESTFRSNESDGMGDPIDVPVTEVEKWMYLPQ